MDKPRNRNINEALQFYNRVQKIKLISKQLAYESKLFGEDSMKVLADFDQLEEYDTKKV